MVTTRDSYADLGQRTHQVCAQVARHGQEMSWTDLTDFAWTQAAQNIHERPAKSGIEHTRRRGTKIMVAGFAACFGQYFLPTLGWTLLGAELELPGRVRADLGWTREADGAVILDEIKVDIRPGTLGRGPTQDQLTALLKAGRTAYADRFAGVRLLYVAAPRRSLFWHPDGRVSALDATGLWFEGVRPITARLI